MSKNEREPTPGEHTADECRKSSKDSPLLLCQELCQEQWALQLSEQRPPPQYVEQRPVPQYVEQRPAPQYVEQEPAPEIRFKAVTVNSKTDLARMNEREYLNDSLVDFFTQVGMEVLNEEEALVGGVRAFVREGAKRQTIERLQSSTEHANGSWHQSSVENRF